MENSPVKIDAAACGDNNVQGRSLLADLVPKGRVCLSQRGPYIVGRPNVGKSSLLNRLAGREAAIVSKTPGTTRDIVEENILIEGAPLNLLDTAGIRESKDDIEAEGIKHAVN